MHRLEEMDRLQPVDQIVGQPIVDHHRTQHRRLGFDVARQLNGFGRGRGGECQSRHGDRYSPTRHRAEIAMRWITGMM